MLLVSDYCMVIQLHCSYYINKINRVHKMHGHKVVYELF